MLRFSRLVPLLAVLALAGCGGGHHTTTPTPAACAHGYQTAYGCSAHSPTFGLPPKGLTLPRPVTGVRTVEQFDSVTLGEIPSNASAVAGYTSGSWPTFVHLAALWPHAHRVSVAVNAGHIAKCLDIEPGDATPSQAAAWVAAAIHFGVFRPCLYENAATLPAVLANLHAAGIARSSVLLWVADWTFHPGLIAGADCVQWSDHALGRNLDESTCAVGFYAGKPRPKPKPKPRPKPQPKPARVLCFGKHGTPKSKACKPVVALYAKRVRAEAASSKALRRVHADLKAHKCHTPYKRTVCRADGRTVRVLSQRVRWFTSHAAALRKQYS
jgi:hypothetical protein